jgi:hypothetical protein
MGIACLCAFAVSACMVSATTPGEQGDGRGHNGLEYPDPR